MTIRVQPAIPQEILALRTRYRAAMNCQIVHDSIHRRDGWTLSYLLMADGAAAGFGSVAVGGPWKGKPTVFELYVLPERRARAFDLFEALVAAGGARFMEVQSNDVLLTILLHTYAREVAIEKIVFQDGGITNLPAPDGALLRRVTPEEEARRAMELRQGGLEVRLEIHGENAANGGVLFHYNAPYGDVYMEVAEPFRRRGLGSYLVQELKRRPMSWAASRGARCNPDNVASRRTLLKAGFVPCGTILHGALPAR